LSPVCSRIALDEPDATFAAMADEAGVECLLVGRLPGMVCQGLHSTVV
jgi:3-methyl-2-oxobutanoate hydroxymethyltransferase